MRTRSGRGVAGVREDVKLDAVFREFMGSAVHMLLVHAAPPPQQQPPWSEVGGGGGGGVGGAVVGLITLEDVLEEMIQVEGVACPNIGH
jgi:CBS domain containing-hemolysin-like protein